MLLRSGAAAAATAPWPDPRTEQTRTGWAFSPMATAAAPAGAGEWLLPAPELRPEPPPPPPSGDPSALALLRVLGSGGSSWTTAEARRAAGYDDPDAAPSNFYALSPDPARPPSSWAATVAATPRLHGEQAGLCAFGSLASWVKLVVEGDGNGGVAIVFADQRDGKPFMRAKRPLPAGSDGGSVALRLVAQPGSGTTSAFFRLGTSTPWEAVRPFLATNRFGGETSRALSCCVCLFCARPHNSKLEGCALSRALA